MEISNKLKNVLFTTAFYSNRNWKSVYLYQRNYFLILSKMKTTEGILDREI